MRRPHPAHIRKRTSGGRWRTFPRLVTLAVLLSCTIAGAATVTPRAALAAEPIDLLIHSRFITWRAAAGTRVVASLERRGAPRASAEAVAGPDGVVSLALVGSGGAPITVQSGDALLLTAEGSEPERIDIPPFGAEVDPLTDVVAGQAPSHATVSIALVSADGAEVERTTSANADGRFEHDFSGEFDIRPGTRGSVVLVAPDGHVFRAQVGALSALVTLGWPELEARVTPGADIGAAVGSGGRRPAASSPVKAGADGFGSGETIETVDRAIISLRDPIAPGDVVTLTRASGLLPDAEFTFTVPDMNVAIDTARRQLRGTAPAGGGVSIVLHGPDGSTYHASGTADAGGRFDIAVPDAPIGPGWRAEATWDGPNGVKVRAIAVATSVTLGLHTTQVFGIAPPYSDVSIMRFAADGERTGPWRAPVDREGRFMVLLLGRDGGRTVEHRIEAGDIIQFDFAEGDPISVDAPHLNARTDPDGEAIEGEAPPGAELVARASRGPADPLPATVFGAADASGVYRLEFGTAFDIEPPVTGTLTLLRRDGHAIELGWASVALEAEVFGATISGNAAPERDVSVEVRDAGGAMLATATTRAVTRVDDIVRWSIALTDSLGKPLRLAPGDVIVATVGDELVELAVAPLEGVIHVADDLVAGRTAPNTPVTISVSNPSGGGGERGITSDGTGTFALDFTGTADIQYNDRIRLVASIGRHWASRAIGAPGVLLDLGAATIAGSIEPSVTAHIALVRAGAIVGSATVRTEDDATFEALIRDLSGRPAPPVAGDRIVVSAPEADAEREIELDVPELLIALDAGSDRISGRAPAGAALEIAFAHAFDEGALQRALEIGADGTWDAGEIDAFDVKPGTRATARLRLPSGHLVRRSTVLPVLNIAFGQDIVCGQADPLAPLSIRALGSDGAERSSASVIADGDGIFTARLSGAGGGRIALDEGQTVVATVGGGEIRVPIDGFTAQLDSARSVISGTVRAGAHVTLVAPLDAAACSGRVEGVVDRPAARRTVADSGGHYAFALRGDVGASVGQGFEVAHLTAEQHRIFRSIRGVRAEIHVYQDLVEGRALPFAELAGRLVEPTGGEASATGTAITLSDGSFALRLSQLDGSPAAIRPGQVIELVSTILPDRVESVRAEHLVFDIGGDGAILGSAAPSRTVDLSLTLVDGRSIEIARPADDDGIWSFGPDDVPIRAGWTLEDVARVRAKVEVGGAHAMVADAQLIDLEKLGRRIFLPRAFRAWP